MALDCVEEKLVQDVSAYHVNLSDRGFGLVCSCVFLIFRFC